MTTLPGDLIAVLKRRRCVLKLSQADLAARVGVADSQISRWEKRRQAPSLDALCAWAQELGYGISLVAGA